MAGQPGFFDVAERYAALSAAGDPLERLSAVVDFEIFRPVLDAALARSDRSRGGRPPYDAVLMFRILVLQALYSLSDEQAEFQLRDRLSFMRFTGLGLHQAVPDAKTIWLYREQLKQAGAIEELFRRFDEVLAAQGFLAMGGQIIDATIVAAPRQKLTRAEKATLRDGGTPADWSRAKRAQKDREARWTLKRGRTKPEPEGTQRQAIPIAVPVFGTKSHIGMDRRHGLIRRWTVTDAAQHDSAAFPPCSIPGTPRAPSGPTRPTAPSAIWRCWSGAACPRGSSSAGRRGANSPSSRPRPMPRAPGSALASNMSLPRKSTAWGCSCAPLAWPGRG
jgi:transposase, IS5 family